MSPTSSPSSMVRFRSLPKYNHDPSFKTPVCVSWGQFVVSVLQCIMYCTGSTHITPPLLFNTLLTCVRSSSMLASTLKVQRHPFLMNGCFSVLIDISNFLIYLLVERHDVRVPDLTVVDYYGIQVFVFAWIPSQPIVDPVLHQ